MVEGVTDLGSRSLRRLLRGRGDTPPPPQTDPPDPPRTRKDRTPTRLGAMLLDRMAALGMTRQVDLVRASQQGATDPAAGGISASTVSRLICADGYTPDRETLRLLSVTLRLDYRQLVLFVFDDTAPTPTGAVDRRVPRQRRTA